MIGQAALLRLPFSMSRFQLCIAVVSCLFFRLSAPVYAIQAKKPVSAGDASASARKGVELAKTGHCKEAIPALKKATSQVADRDLQRQAGFAGVRCAMFLDQPDTAIDFLRFLNREFPRDPDVLYTSVHTYSDLSTRTSAELANTAPDSYQALELNAEALEMQGKWDEAAKVYEQILKQNPNLPGMHYRLGRILVSKPGFGPETADQAKQEFEKELTIDPSNAGALYVLGELAKQKEQWDEAILRFSQATQLDPGFGDAFIGLGGSLVSVKRFSDAVQPLENAVKLQPENPAAHYLLAIAYDRTGRKEEGAKEFAIQRQLTQKGAAGEGGPQSQASPN
jgi:tetratricopeptide (TPR) repeat protein